MARKETQFADLLGIGAEGSPQLQFLGEAGFKWHELGHPDKAATVFEGLAVLAPNDPLPHLGLAEVALAEGKFKDADRYATLALRSDNADRTALAYGMLLRGQARMGLLKFDAARESWRRALDLDASGPMRDVAANWIALLDDADCSKFAGNGTESSGQGTRG